MKRVDLLERVPRACLSFASDHGPQTQPVALVWHDGRYLVGIPDGAGRLPGYSQEAVLLIMKGSTTSSCAPSTSVGRRSPPRRRVGAPAGHTWVEVVPLKTVAWDYGAFREEQDEG